MAGPADFKLFCGDVELAVRDYGGEGRPVVLVHGGNASLAYYDDLAPKIRTGAHVVAYDLRGHGQSAQGELGLDLHASDLLGLVRELTLDDAVVVGASAGAFVAVKAAAREPRAFGGVVCVDGPLVDPEGASWWRDERDAALAMMVGSLQKNPARAPWRGSRADLEQELAKLETAGSSWQERNFVEVAPGVFERRPDLATSADLIVSSQQPFEDTIKAMTCPMLSLVGCDSPLLFGSPEARQAAAETFSERFPDVESHLVDGGHDLVGEHPDVVAEQVLDWIRKAR